MNNYITNRTKIEIIFKVVSDVSKVSILEIKSKCRKREIITPRFVAMALIKKYVKTITWKALANEFNGRDHSTAINALNKHNDYIETFDSHYYPLFNECNQEYLREMFKIESQPIVKPKIENELHYAFNAT